MSSRAPGTESDTRCDTAAPSDEARDVAEAALYRYAQEEWGWGSHEYHSVIGAVDVVFEAVDLPRVRAEERAATLRAHVKWLRADGHWRLRDVADALEARFNPPETR